MILIVPEDVVDTWQDDGLVDDHDVEQHHGHHQNDDDVDFSLMHGRFLAERTMDLSRARKRTGFGWVSKNRYFDSET